MSREQEKPRAVVAEKDALSVYFEALLREPQVELVETPVATPVEAPPAPVVVVEQAAAPAAVQVEGQPQWGAETFQALMFRVAGLTLAVPLVELSGVQEWEDGKVTPMPGRVPWYLGLTLYREHNVPVVDTAQLVMPEERQANLPPWQERLRHVVFIADGRWGLACDELGDVVTLRPEDVRWRTTRTKRRWLAGTVIEHMCALLDPPVFADVLATGLQDMPTGDEQAK